MQIKNIGWIGTGLMGKPMVMHLMNAGYQLFVYTRTKSKAVDLIGKGAVWCATPAEVSTQSDVVFTMVGYPSDVEEVYFGENGILSALHEGMVLVDMTTTKPALAVQISAVAHQHKTLFLDAPVSGGEVGAINGTLSVMMGGDKKALDMVLPLLETFSKNRVFQGAAGAGQHTKMCNQITIAGTMIGVCESLVYAKKAGLDLTIMLQSISKGAAGCWTLDVLAPKIANHDFAPGFMVDHFVKDLGIALEEAEIMKLSLPGLALAKQLYMSVKALGKGKAGTQALFLSLERLSSM